MRSEARIHTTVAAILAIVVCCAPLVATASSDPAGRAAAYLVSRQQRNGAFGNADQPADAAIEAAASIAAAGGDARAISRALTYAATDAPARATSRAGTAGRIVLGLLAVEADPAHFHGFDYVAQLASFYDAVTGKYDDGLYGDALAVLAIGAATNNVPAQALTYLRTNQCADGGFAHDSCLQGSDIDTAALVLSAIVRAGVASADDVSSKTVSFLRSAQNGDGGWGLKLHEPTNANSTGLVISALVARGESLPHDPVRALRALQLANGGVRYREDLTKAGDYATVQAIPGLLKMAYPLRASVRSAAVTRSVPSAATQRRQATEAKPAPNAGCAPGQRGMHHARLVVVFGDARVRTFCIAFRERSITGFDLLKRSGLILDYQDTGGGAILICAIEREGRDYPNESCLPPCPVTGGCTFWGYYTFAGSWRFSSLGVGTREVHDGDIDGWRFGAHAVNGGGCPPDVKVTCASGIVPIAAHHASPTNALGIGAFAAILAVMTMWAAAVSRARRKRDAE